MSQRPASYTDPATIAALQALLPDDFKVLFCFFANGGWDSHNMFVPGAGNSNLGFYENARPTGVRIEAAEKLPLSNTTWALHPALDHFRDRWNANQLAILQDVGTLNEPTTAAQYLDINTASRFRPLSIGAHDVQQRLWQNGLQHNPPARTTGWFGRAMDLLDATWNTPQPGKENSLLMSLISRAGNNLQNRPYPPKGTVALPMSSRPAPASYGTTPTGANGVAGQIRQVFTEAEGAGLPADPDHNLMRATWKYVLAEGLAAPGFVNAELVALPGNVNAALGDAAGLRPAVQAIHTAVENAALGIRRMVVYVNAPGGWDHHASLRPNQDPLLAIFNGQITALTNAIDLLGLRDQVTFFAETEFGRTFRSNNNQGTDHGWSGHSFIWGNAVLGGLYGATPDYSPTGPQAINGGNSFVPTTSTEQYYATLLRWFGIPAALIPMILPASAVPRAVVGTGAQAYTPVAFSPQNLDFLPAVN
ncbi:MAG: DUF1501 domain-containing protein [Wenzhouxiangella sp.]|nr:MAG: DUF1501 domain-containing protein [Wenzhouxiangella sp.]